jgi:hypothetical protein
MDDLPNVVSKLPTWLQYLIAVFVILATIGLPISKLTKLFWRRPMWPSRANWAAICLPAKPNEEHYGAAELVADRPLHYPGLRWCQMRNMEVSDYYQIDLQKSRVISRIELKSYGKRYPKKYSLEIAQNGEFELVGKYDGPIEIDFKKPIKARVLLFKIIEPMRDEDTRDKDGKYPSWCIYDVRLTEARLFGRFWKKEIPAK